MTPSGRVKLPRRITQYLIHIAAHQRATEAILEEDLKISKRRFSKAYAEALSKLGLFDAVTSALEHQEVSDRELGALLTALTGRHNTRPRPR